jgi:hypothetical protein
MERPGIWRTRKKFTQIIWTDGGRCWEKEAGL